MTHGARPGGRRGGGPPARKPNSPGKSAAKSAGKFASKSAGKFASKPAGKFASKPVGKFESKSTGKSAGIPAPKSAATGARPDRRRRGTRNPEPTLEAPAPKSGPMRVQRALARAGVASRRSADALVAAGRVHVNGAVAVVGQTVDPDRDLITIDASPIPRPAAAVWLLLNKPTGVLTTARDETGAGRRTVFDLVPTTLRRPGLTYVGRLDFMTEGVLLLTTDGDAANRLTHPSHAVDRTYIATVQGNAMTAGRALRQGIELEDGPMRPADVVVRSVGNRRWELELTIAEGRTREVRRACEMLGLRVERLVRTRFGPITLGDLEAGSVRPLTALERRRLEGES